MSIFKESADENLVQARHIVEPQLAADETVFRNSLALNAEFPKVKYVRDVSNDEYFKKLVIIPARFSNLFLKPKEKYRENEEVDGESVLMEIEYLGKDYTLKTYSNINCKIPIKKRTKVLVMNESFPTIVINEISIQLMKLINNNKSKHLTKIIAISTSNQVETVKFFKANSKENLSNCEFISTYAANMIAYLKHDLSLNVNYLIIPSEGPATLPKIGMTEISEMCDYLKVSLNLDDARHQIWKTFVVKMWKIMDGESVNSLYL